MNYGEVLRTLLFWIWEHIVTEKPGNAAWFNRTEFYAFGKARGDAWYKSASTLLTRLKNNQVLTYYPVVAPANTLIKVSPDAVHNFVCFYMEVLRLKELPSWAEEWRPVQKTSEEASSQPTSLVEDIICGLREELCGAIKKELGEATSKPMCDLVLKLEQNITQVGQMKSQFKQIKEAVTGSGLRDLQKEVEKLRQENALLKELVAPLAEIMKSMPAMVELWELMELHRPDLQVIEFQMESIEALLQKLQPKN